MSMTDTGNSWMRKKGRVLNLKTLTRVPEPGSVPTVNTEPSKYPQLWEPVSPIYKEAYIETPGWLEDGSETR